MAVILRILWCMTNTVIDVIHPTLDMAPKARSIPLVFCNRAMFAVMQGLRWCKVTTLVEQIVSPNSRFINNSQGCKALQQFTKCR
eukprot:2405100-Karenia_brevis.AAC.1